MASFVLSLVTVLKNGLDWQMGHPITSVYRQYNILSFLQTTLEFFLSAHLVLIIENPRMSEVEGTLDSLLQINVLSHCASHLRNKDEYDRVLPLKENIVY